ncbi:hypothetical protein HD554DRAFT_1628386 [Boletus coccyginus]|nr:hypothetical protein HD554DRAFT_1628386 [Boletus coccyginus]
MTSDSFIKDHLSKVKSKLSNPLSFRGTGSAATQVDGSQSFVKQAHPFKTLSRSSTNLLATGSAEPKSDYGAGNTSSPGDPPSSTPPLTINVVLFGETGVGKSSVINLIARKEVAKVSSDVNGCTMQSTRYDIPFDDMNFCIFDTIGLEEPQMGVNGYLKAIERAYELIMKLGAAGGIHLLLFCMRGGRITATTQSNYRLFCECLCNTKVPIALVFTGLEREVEMEDWWTRNKTHIEHYGIKSDGHACITAVQDEIPGEDLKYMESQKRIRELLKTCALKNEAFQPEPHSWFAKLGKGMKSFIEKHKNPKRRDVMRVLTHRCKLDPETARRIAEMMEKGDTDPETKDGNQDEQAGSREGEGGSNLVVGKGESEVEKSATKPDAPPNQHGDVKVEPSNDALEAGGDSALASRRGDVKVGPPNDALEAEGDSALASQHSDVKVGPPNDALEAGGDSALASRHGDVKVEPPNDALEARRDNALASQHGDVKVESRPDKPEGRNKNEAANENVVPRPRRQAGADKWQVTKDERERWRTLLDTSAVEQAKPETRKKLRMRSSAPGQVPSYGPQA